MKNKVFHTVPCLAHPAAQRRPPAGGRRLTADSVLPPVLCRGPDWDRHLNRIALHSSIQALIEPFHLYLMTV